MGDVIQVGGQGQLQPAIALILPSALGQIRDYGNVLCDCINLQDYEEFQGIFKPKICEFGMFLRLIVFARYRFVTSTFSFHRTDPRAMQWTYWC